MSELAVPPQVTPTPQPAPKTIAELPGPPGWPLVGNTLSIERSQFHLQLEAWQRTYGNMYRLSLGGNTIVVVSDPALIAQALRARPEIFGRTARLARVTAEAGFNGIFTANGDDWRRQRPLIMASFDPGHNRKYFPSLVKVTQRFAGRWQRAVARQEPIDLQGDLMRFTVDVISGLAFGADINTLEKGDDVIQQHLDQILPTIFKRVLSPIAYWRHFKLPADRAVDAHLLALQQAVNGFIEDARQRLLANPALRDAPENMIEAMIAARDKPGSPLTDADVSGNVLTMLLAGEDTTANTLAWMIYLLHQHPEALARAQAEVRTALGDDTLPTRLEQLENLDFVEACAHETMRLKPVAPILPHQAYKDTELGGVAFPAGTLAIFLLRAGAMHESHFLAPEQFNPNRWLKTDANDNIASAESTAAGASSTAGPSAPDGSNARPKTPDAISAKRAAMPFGAGPRMCPGRYLALMEIKMAMAMLLGSFEIESVDTPDGAPAREHLAFTMAPLGLRLRLRLRDGHAMNNSISSIG